MMQFMVLLFVVVGIVCARVGADTATRGLQPRVFSWSDTYPTTAILTAVIPYRQQRRSANLSDLRLADRASKHARFAGWLL
jgi:hypothetical protein